jgi:high-affinity iron transporter
MTMSLQSTTEHGRRPLGGGVVAFLRRTLLGPWGLAVAGVALLGWRFAVSHGGTPDPTDPATHLGHGAVVLDSAILVLREGLETILVLAAVTASLRGRRSQLRRPVAAGGAAALAAAVATWFVAIAVTSAVGAGSLELQAATGLLAIAVLLVVMNWFFHKVYWTGWIAHHHRRRNALLADDGHMGARRTVLGLALLGFTSVYREGFEVVLFLQNLRLRYGSGTVLEGVAIGAVLVAAIGTVTFAMHRRLPYRKMLVATGVLLGGVLLVMVGENVQEMQQAGWLATTPIPGLHVPGWLGLWFSIFANWQTVVAQALAAALVIGSYLAAEHRLHHRPVDRNVAPASPAILNGATASARPSVHAPVAALKGEPRAIDTLEDGPADPSLRPAFALVAASSPIVYRSALAQGSRVGHRYGRATLAHRRSARG